MSSDNAKTVFLNALEIASPEDRRAYVAAQCAGSESLRAEVEELLRHHAQIGTLSPLASLAETSPPRSAERPGTLIGPYKLLEQIGEGGMGAVYVAEQKVPVERRVALKIIKPGMDSRQVIARFEAERQALALMDHPHIAKVLDAGTVASSPLAPREEPSGHGARSVPATECGRPYFVMELVKGVPITQYCDEKHLTPRQRLELFISVCQAVQHAHQKGIIHRDLKPSNVLVAEYDEQPVAKVIDFGVSKAVGQRLTEKTVYTEMGQIVGTIEYMSPEQAKLNQLDIDTRTDVYSLGVLLYELLTGSPPFDKQKLRSAAFDEMLRIIREEEPPKPSTRLSDFSRVGQGRAATAGPPIEEQERWAGAALVPPYNSLASIAAVRGTEPAKLTKLIRGELDWIVMKCLEKDRSRRYESANGLAMDIERYLRDEPIAACPPTAAYRFRKFARKYRAVLTTGVLVAFSLIVGTTVSTWQAVRATKAEAQANANANLASANAQEAKLRAKEASAQRNEARQQRDEAQKQRDEVKAVNEKLLATQTMLRDTLYVAHLESAHRSASATVLDQYVPKAGEPDLRGFEWYYLQRLGHPELLAMQNQVGQWESLAFSPDGSRLAGAAVGDTVKVWDSQTGRELFSLKSGAADPSFTPDGKLADPDIARGRYHVENVTFSPDGKRLASGSKVWDAHTGQELLPVKGHGWIRAFSPDGQRLAGNGYRGSPGNWASHVVVWDAVSGEELLSLKGHIVTPHGHNDHICEVAYSPDGKKLASASHDETVKLWDAHTGEPLFTYRGHKAWVEFVVFSPDSRHLASGSNDGTSQVWEAATGKQLYSFTGKCALAFSQDGKRLAGGWGGSIRVWDAKTGRELRNLRAPSALCIAFSPDGQRVASGSYNSVMVWDANRVRRADITLKRAEDQFWGVVFSPDGQRLASGSGNTVKILEARTASGEATGKELQALKGHTDKVWSVAYSQDGKRVASGSIDNTIKIWDAATGEDLQTLSGHTGAVRTVVFHPSSRELASVADDKTVKVWDLETREERQSFAGAMTTGIYTANKAVAYSPDGKLLAAGGPDDTVKIWRALDGRELVTIPNQPARNTFCLQFSPDGRFLARGGNGVTIWDAQSGQLVQKVGGHTTFGVTFSPDGKRAVSARLDAIVRIWNSQSGQPLLDLPGHEGRVCHVAFSPDGHRLASTGIDGTLRIWDATPLNKTQQTTAE